MTLAPSDSFCTPEHLLAPVRATTVDLRLGDQREVLADVTCDLLCVDAPYSKRTHSGHDNGTASANRLKDGAPWKRKNGKYDPEANRRSITYKPWSASDVHAFVQSWSSRTRGWMVSITDHVLAPEWEKAMELAGRYVFAPLPFVETGSRVRLSGDGPSAWTCWMVVGRPRSEEFLRWGTLRGAYVASNERKPAIGGKPLGLMQDVIRDYSRESDVVCDPCAGGGTTLLAARMEGRSCVGAEMDPDTFAIAADRLAHLPVGTDREPSLFR